MITKTAGEVLLDVTALLEGQVLYAAAVVDYMKRVGVVFQDPPGSPCRACGKPHDTRSCEMAGCPLGADL